MRTAALSFNAALQSTEIMRNAVTGACHDHLLTGDFCTQKGRQANNALEPNHSGLNALPNGRFGFDSCRSALEPGTVHLPHLRHSPPFDSRN